MSAIRKSALKYSPNLKARSVSGPAISCCQRSRTEIGKRILGSICTNHFRPTQEKNGRVQAGLTFSVFIGIQTV